MESRGVVFPCELVKWRGNSGGGAVNVQDDHSERIKRVRSSTMGKDLVDFNNQRSGEASSSKS